MEDNDLDKALDKAFSGKMNDTLKALVQPRSRKHASLHHVFIQAEKSPIPVDDEIPTIPIKSEFLDNIADTAARYPDMPITIWVDFYGRGNNSPELMDKLNEQSPAPGKVTFRSLDDALVGMTPELQRDVDTIFEREHTKFKDLDSPIWQQVDLARALVLKHTLENPDMPNYAIYADMDIIVEDKFFKKLDVYGIVTSRNYASEEKAIHQKIENNIFGMERDCLPVLTDDLIPRMVKLSIEEHVNGWHGHIDCFSQNPIIKQVTDHDVAQILVIPDEIDFGDEVKESYQQDDPTTEELKELMTSVAQAIRDNDPKKAGRLHKIIGEKEKELNAGGTSATTASDKPNIVSDPFKNNSGMS